ncbi:phosphoribosyltransferase [Desulfurococcus mucosus]|uniref:Phosphoribosyltransferase n=1 Tax=Desulfurococcus mucosus (strain ATCC 35584 / DSM 2162 / JCM 9187 / O7/1) TaxID=765177 RepID=E8RA34_DESM0|nr:phosphoribosyltransferase [Desulfurococcus mucosus]ADV65360.1 phosphoribosyltransferase [Desulfurococcus mucosus DSM 2162]
MPRVKTHLVTWDEVVDWSRNLARLVRESGFRPDLVVAVSRGGFVPARLVCDFLGVENLASIQSQHWTEAAKAGERAILKYPYRLDASGLNVLVVDDIVDTGETLRLARDYVRDNWGPREVKTAALQWISPVAKYRPDYYYLEVKEWVWFQYPWTRLEDTYQFIKRMMSEAYRETGRREWGFSEVVEGFREWYGIDVGEAYYREALRVLVEKGVVDYDAARDRYVLRV